MSSSIEGPLILDEQGNVEAYPDSAELIADLEPLDVQTGRYEAFDQHGNRIDITTDGVTVQLVLSSAPPLSRTELADRVRQYARAIGQDRLAFNIEHADLDEMLKGVLKVPPRRGQTRPWALFSKFLQYLRSRK